MQNVRKSGQIVRIVMWSNSGSGAEGQVVRVVGLVIMREEGREEEEEEEEEEDRHVNVTDDLYHVRPESCMITRPGW